MAILRVGSLLTMQVLLVGLYCSSMAAPTQDLDTINFMTGLLVSREYTRKVRNKTSVTLNC